MQRLLQGCFAHTRPDCPPSTWQPLADHLNQVAARAVDFAAPFHSEEWACAAGWLHDLGKAASAFQGYLRRANQLDDEAYDSGRVNHSTAGAALAEDRWGPFAGRALAYVAAGHHAGLPDYGTAEAGNAALVIRLENYRRHFEGLGPDVSEIVAGLPAELRPPSFLKPRGYHFWIRMVFSCLVDADYLDTEAFMDPEQTRARGPSATLEELKRALDLHLAQLAGTARKTPVNAIRQTILADCRAAATRPPGSSR